MSGRGRGAGAAAGGGAAPVPPVQAQAAAPPALVIRARNPAMWSQNNELNFGSKQDRDYYKQAIEKLEGDAYDGKDLPVFLKKLEGRAYQFNWLELLTYQVGNPPEDKNLLEHYGEITRDVIKAKAVTYLGTNTREDQDSDMLYNCLRKSITDTVFAKIAKEVNKYKIEVQGRPYFDGPAYLRAIIEHTYTNTKANVTAARENLANLKEYMEGLNDSNITQFNEHVKTQIEMLDAAGARTTELVTNLFKGYSRVKDKAFREWVRLKKLQYNEGTYQIDDDARDFMEAAKKHYTDALLAKEWMQADDEQQTILALQTEVRELKASKAKGKYSSDKHKGGSTKKRPSEWDWKHVPPKFGEPNTKKYKGKLYYWCKNHSLWCLHKPKECKLNENIEEDKKKKVKGKKDIKNLRLRAFESLFDSSSEEENNNEEESSDSTSVASGTSNTSK
jgi:hypothetical protein